MTYTSLMLTYYATVMTFVRQIAQYVTIDLIFAIVAFIIIVMAVYFFVMLCISFEARTDRALTKLNKYFYRYPIMKNNSLPILNNIIRHAPKEFGYKWNEYLERKDAAPSIYLSFDGCVNKAIMFNKASYYTKILLSFTLFSSILILLLGLAKTDPATAFAEVLYSLLLAPILLIILGGIFATIISIKGIETYKNMLGDFAMFQRNIDHSARGLSGIDENVIETLINTNNDSKRSKKFKTKPDQEEYNSHYTEKKHIPQISEKNLLSSVDEDFLTKLRNTPTKHKDNGAPPTNFNLGGEVKPFAANTNLTANEKINKIENPSIPLEQNTSAFKPEAIYVPEADIVKDESDELIKQYAEEKERILAEIAKIKEENASYEVQNKQINQSIDTVHAENTHKGLKEMLSSNLELEEVLESPIEENIEISNEMPESVVYAKEENIPNTTETDLSVPKKRGRKPKAKIEDDIDLSSTLDQLASAMENLKKK
ncbi:MAG: hypothetical protein PHO33_01465 [Clostridia bacterium]|nr:hypothetical protein [Clostridia bacterium]